MRKAELVGLTRAQRYAACYVRKSVASLAHENR